VGGFRAKPSLSLLGGDEESPPNQGREGTSEEETPHYKRPSTLSRKGNDLERERKEREKERKRERERERE